MPRLTIDGREIEAKAGQTVMEAATENGIFIPYFCWHPKLSVPGNCRICVVGVAEKDGGEWVERGNALQVVAATVPWRGLRIELLAVNLASSPLKPRAPALARVVELVGERRPDLVIGDFNAPRRSRALTRLPAGWRHAYDEAGWGWSATWPVPVPLLAIDQALVGPRFQVVGYALAGTPWSDHRLQQVELAPLRPAPAP